MGRGVLAQKKLLKVRVLSGGKEADSMWGSISLDSPARCQGKHLHLRGKGTASSPLSNLRERKRHYEEQSDLN